MQNTLTMMLIGIAIFALLACNVESGIESTGGQGGDHDRESENEVDGPDGNTTPYVEEDCVVNPSEFDGGTISDFAAEGVEFDEELFPLGVQAGAMTAEDVIVWTFTEDKAQKTLRIWREDSEGGVTMVVDKTVETADGFIKEHIGGLAPKTTYFYGFFEDLDGPGAKRSMIGRFKTAFPENCAAPLTIGGTHGTNRTLNVPFTALAMTAEYEMDAFIHLGDFSYNYGADTLEGYRSEWRKTLTRPNLQVLTASIGWYIVWDDHEITDNTLLYSLPPEVLKAGKDAFFETVPVPRHENDSYWRSYRWGKSVEFFALDARHERDEESIGTDDPIFLGKEQMAWLKEGLRGSSCHFKAVLNSVPITLYTSLAGLRNDRWEAYGKQRDEILDFIVDNGIRNVWWLTGDFHLGTVNRLERAGARRHIWEVMMGPGGNGPNPLWTFYEQGWTDPEEIAPADQFRFFGGEFMATLMTFDPGTDSVRVIFVEAESGDVLYDESFRAED